MKSLSSFNKHCEMVATIIFNLGSLTCSPYSYYEILEATTNYLNKSITEKVFLEVLSSISPNFATAFATIRQPIETLQNQTKNQIKWTNPFIYLQLYKAILLHGNNWPFVSVALFKSIEFTEKCRKAYERLPLIKPKYASKLVVGKSRENIKILFNRILSDSKSARRISRQLCQYDNKLVLEVWKEYFVVGETAYNKLADILRYVIENAENSNDILKLIHELFNKLANKYSRQQRETEVYNIACFLCSYVKIDPSFFKDIDLLKDIKVQPFRIKKEYDNESDTKGKHKAPCKKPIVGNFESKYFTFHGSPKKLSSVPEIHEANIEKLRNEIVDTLTKRKESTKLTESETYLLKTASTIIYNTSPAALNKLTKLSPFFSSKTVEAFVKEEKKELESWIMNTEHIHDIINKYYGEDLKKGDDFYACIAGDGCSIINDGKKEVLYCFELLPLSGHKQVQPINFALNISAKNLRTKFDEVVSEIKACGIKVIFIATDGETATNEFHSKFFETHINTEKSFIDQVDDMYKLMLKNEIIIPITDLLHMLKNARAHLLNHLLFVSPENLICVNLSIMRYLMPGPALNDLSMQGKMKDGLALDLFSWDSYIKMLQNKRYDAAFFILPFLLLNEAMRSTCLSNIDRLKFIDAAYQTFLYHLKTIEENDNDCITQRFGSSSLGTFIGSKIWLQRAINTCIAYGLAIKMQIEHNINDLHLGRLSSHDVECLFGLLRLNSNGDERYQKCLHIIVKTLITRQCEAEVGLTSTKRTRINTGGTRLSAQTDAIPEMNFNPSQYVKILYNMLINVQLQPETLNNFAIQTNTYTIKITNDPTYPKIPNAHPWAGNRPLMRYTGPYKSSVLPLVQGNLGPLEAYHKNHKSGALVLMSNQIVDFFFNEAERAPIKGVEIIENNDQCNAQDKDKDKDKDKEEEKQVGSGKYLYGDDEINYLIEATNRIIETTDDQNLRNEYIKENEKLKDYISPTKINPTIECKDINASIKTSVATKLSSGIRIFLILRMLQLKWGEEDSMMKEILLNILNTYIKEYQQSRIMINEYRNEAEETCNEEELEQINLYLYQTKKPVRSIIFSDVVNVMEYDIMIERKYKEMVKIMIDNIKSDIIDEKEMRNINEYIKKKKRAI